jgi:hypothetical protein
MRRIRWLLASLFLVMLCSAIAFSLFLASFAQQPLQIAFVRDSLPDSNLAFNNWFNDWQPTNAPLSEEQRKTVQAVREALHAQLSAPPRSEQIQLDGVMVSAGSFVVSSIGAIFTIVFGWRKERRDAREFNLKIVQLELQIAELRSGTTPAAPAESAVANAATELTSKPAASPESQGRDRIENMGRET